MMIEKGSIKITVNIIDNIIAISTITVIFRQYTIKWFVSVLIFLH